MKKRLLSWDVWAHWEDGVNLLLPEDIDLKSDAVRQKAIEAFRKNGHYFDHEDPVFFEFIRYEDGDEEDCDEP
jgi:hypothetical protein